MNEASPRKSPFVGLVPFSEQDAPYFFGRDAETEIIIANLMASRLTVLYGESGVGKSSVLGASVVPRLRKLAQTNLDEYGSPEFAVVQYSQWTQNPIAGLVGAVREGIERAPGQHEPVEHKSAGSLVETLGRGSEAIGGDLLVIFDQFEEYFLYRANEDSPGTFAHEFPLAVNRADLRVSFLIAIREDALAKLDCFKGRIPNLFDNYLRIEHLRREAAADAISKPIEQYNRDCGDGDTPVTIEPKLVDAVLDQVQTGKAQRGRTGHGSAETGDGAETGDCIKAPYLQLVMSRLWDEESQAQSHVLRLKTLDKMGGAEEIVRTHVDRTMTSLTARQQKIAAGIYDRLVTPSGSKIALTAGDLAAYARVPEPKVQPVLTRLADPEIRILRPVAPPPDQADVPRYEIFHDVLAAAVLEWLSTYRIRKVKNSLNLAVFGLVVLTCLTLALFWALSLRKKVVLTKIVRLQPGAEWLDSKRIDLGKARADAAITLFAFGDSTEALDALRVAEDPESLTQFINLPKERGIDPATLFAELTSRESVSEVERLYSAGERSIRYGLILALGEISREKLETIPEHQREAWVDKLVGWYRDDPSSAVHGACGWVLQQWDQEDRVTHVDQTPIRYDPKREWFVRKVQYSDGEADYFTFVVFKPGMFQMGSPVNERERKEGEHQHRVHITQPFSLRSHEVTQAEYERVMGTNPSEFSKNGLFAKRVEGMETSRFPVEDVSWENAAEFCRKLSNLPEEKAAGRIYRLPTEAEWEYACRAGTQTPWSCGSDENRLGKYANHDSSCGRTTLCGQLRPNLRGLFDMHGNVWEWCHDWYSEAYYKTSPVKDPQGPQLTLERVFRGGSWRRDGGHCRAANRGRVEPAFRGSSLGFRVATDPSSQSRQVPVK